MLGASSGSWRIAKRSDAAPAAASRAARPSVGKSAGGRAYGYVPPALSSSGEIEIDKKQAEIVHQIFAWYADG